MSMLSSCLIAESGLQPVNLIAYFKSMLLPTGIFLGLYFFIFFLLRSWVRKFRSDAAIVAIKISQIPVLIIGIVGFLKLFLLNLETTYPLIKIVEQGLTAAIILIVAFWVDRLIKQVLIYVLKDIAQTSEEQWDDVLVPFAETTLPIIVYVTGILLSIQALGIDLTAILLGLGGLGLFLGYVGNEIVGDFFGGLFLLIDSPFKFGDVLTVNGEQVIIKKIGLKLTILYLIDQHCDLYMSNTSFGSSTFSNISRPTSHYYYSLKISITATPDPSRVVNLIESIILAHPDILGSVDRKLEKIENFYGLSNAIPNVSEKREAGKLRLLAEKKLNDRLLLVETAFDDLAEKISQMEAGGLEVTEIRQIQNVFLEICHQVGLEVSSGQSGKKQKSELHESAEITSTESLIGLIRHWYKIWLQDPNLIQNDLVELPSQWEQKINLLKTRFNKTYKRVSSIDIDETRLDTLISDLRIWMEENFKTTRNEWQDPKIWISDFSASDRTYNVKFYIDDVTLEYYQRGKRIQSEINQELTWQLRRAYLAG